MLQVPEKHILHIKHTLIKMTPRVLCAVPLWHKTVRSLKAFKMTMSLHIA